MKSALPGTLSDESVTLSRDESRSHQRENSRWPHSSIQLCAHCYPVPVAALRNTLDTLKPSSKSISKTPPRSTTKFNTNLTTWGLACLEYLPQAKGSSASSEPLKHLFRQQCHDSRLNCSNKPQQYANISFFSSLPCRARFSTFIDGPPFSTPNLEIVLD